MVPLRLLVATLTAAACLACAGRASAAVTFTLVTSTPTVTSISDFALEVWPQWDQKSHLVLHTAEWELRDVAHHRVVARVPLQFEFWKDSGIDDKRGPQPVGTATRFSDTDLVRFGSLPPGEYRLALIVNGARATNVIGFKIDPAFDLQREPPLRLGMIEAPPGVKWGSLLAWVVGPTPEDADFTNYAVAMAEIRVDGNVTHPEGEGAWEGPVGPYRSGERDVRSFDTEFDLKGADPSKPYDFAIKAGPFRAGPARFDLSSHVLSREWDAGDDAK
jgi:hypothetical protein